MEHRGGLISAAAAAELCGDFAMALLGGAVLWGDSRQSGRLCHEDE